MAQVSITTSYNYNDTVFPVRPSNSYTYASTGNTSISQTSFNISSGTVGVLDFGAIGSSLKYLYIDNISASGFAVLSTNNTMTQKFGQLAPSESIVFSPVTTGLWISGSGAAVTLDYAACGL